MFCDLLLARFGLIEKMKYIFLPKKTLLNIEINIKKRELDPGLDEAIATLIWASPRVSTDIAEFKIVNHF